MAQINKPTDYFNTILTAGGAQSITGVGFQPDLVWNKRRDDTSDHHINDAVRGSSKLLYTNQTLAEQTNANFLTSFDSDGFTTGSGYWNSSADIVAWNWLASNTTASNTDGSITSTVSANTTSGFSIVSYTGTGANATVGHGLGSAPKMVITKSRDTAGLDWRTYHASLGATKFVVLNLTDAAATASNFMNDTEPTSSVFSLGSGTTPNKSGDNYIAYCFAEKKGFSKFGSYVGNANNDGPFCFTGFKPAFVLIKRAEFGADYRGDWQLHDNKRGQYFPGNVVNNRIEPNSNNAEGTGDDLGFDFLSNGFKCRTGNVNYNPSGEQVIYIAFAENPLVGTNNIPATAR